ncbi:MAG: LmeA family phospholipid-binding protein [Mycetocola sp.]
MSELFTDTPAASRRKRRSKRRGWVTALIILVVLAVLAVVGYWLSDRLARQSVEDIVAGQVSAKLPENVTGDVDVTLGGGWAVAQIISGRFDQIAIDAPRLKANDIDLSATATLDGVPRNTVDPVDHISVTVSTSADQLSSLDLLPDAAAQVELGDGEFSYGSSADVLGVSLGYRVTVVPSVADGVVLLTPTAADVDAGDLGISVQPLVDRILDGDPIRLCVADRLPAALSLTDVSVSPTALSLTAEGTDLPLSGSGLSQLGTCE